MLLLLAVVKPTHQYNRQLKSNENIGDENMKKDILIFLQKNYGWIVAMLTGFGVIMSFVLKFIKYIYSLLYFDHYGLSYGLFKSEELGILYDFCLSILLTLCFYSLFYCYKQFYDYYKNKEKTKIKTIITNISLIVISNFYIIFSSNVKISGWYILFNMFFLVGVEILATIIVYKIIKKQEKEEDHKKEFLEYLKILPFCLILIVISLSSSYLISLNGNKDYRIIANDKVIVYTTGEYYLILDCKIEDNKLIIYKGNQTKISNENVESKLISFNEVKIK